MSLARITAREPPSASASRTPALLKRADGTGAGTVPSPRLTTRPAPVPACLGPVRSARAPADTVPVASSCKHGGLRSVGLGLLGPGLCRGARSARSPPWSPRGLTRRALEAHVGPVRTYPR